MSRMNRTARASKILILLGLTLILALGCDSPAQPQPTQSPLSPPEPTASEEALPTATTAVTILPTPDPDWATVTGRLVRAETGEPLVGIVTFLERTTEEHTIPPVLYAPPNDQPSAKTTENGEFTLSEVPADEYVIILYSPPFALQVVTGPDGDQPLLINTRLGEVDDIGTIRVTEFELP